jgi:endoglucanase
MASPHRRRVLQWAAAATFAPLPVHSFAVPRAGSRPVDGFGARGLKGFVLGGVERAPAYLDAMAALGANVARVFFPLRRCRDCQQFGRSANDSQALRRLLDRAAALGMRLIVVGSFDRIDEPAFWTDAALRASFVENWAWFARTFGEHPGLAGMDLMNEPNPPWPSGDIGQAQSAWNPLAEAAIAAIRAAGSSLPVVFEPVAGGSSTGLRGMLPFADSNVVYSIHFYSPHDITHQGVSAHWKRTIPYPAGIEWGLGGWNPKLGVTRIDRTRLELGLGDAVEFQARHDVPIYVGEFSCVRWAPNGSAQRWVADCLAIFTKYSWSWTYHEFRGWPGWDAEIESGDPAATTRSIDAPVMQSLRRAMRSP